VQAPPTHVWFEQAVAPPKVPFDWQVWTLLPVQVTWPGAQTPVHVPPTQVWLLQVVPAVHAPAALQVCVWLPEQLV
jgi:hypothetical protein